MAITIKTSYTGQNHRGDPVAENIVTSGEPTDATRQEHRTKELAAEALIFAPPESGTESHPAGPEGR